MGIRIYQPTSPGRRQSSVNDYAELQGRQAPHKARLRTIKQQAGRNVQGKITVRHRGAGNKRFYRQIDFLQNRYDQPAKVLGVQYDPNRSAHIALIEYTDGAKQYILAPTGLPPNQSVVSSTKAVEIRAGNRMPLAFIPSGTPIHNIEMIPGHGGLLARSAGNAAMVMSVEGDYALVRMPSGEIRKIIKDCSASIGQVSNQDNDNIRWGKAGRIRWQNRRPSVRGKAMNPVDHPHGGGEGVQPIGMKYPKTPWGRHALGVRTRRRTKYSNRLIINRRTK